MTRAVEELREITEPLKRVRRRLRLVAAGSGLALVVWSVLALIILAGIGDFFAHFHGAVRLTLLVGIVAYALFGLVTRVGRPLFSPIPLDVIAARVEKLNPWLQDRLRSSLVFAGEDAMGSEALRHRVVDEALDSTRRLQFADVVEAGELRRGLLLVIPPVLVAVLLAWWQPALFRIGLDRLLMPMAEVSWPRTVQIQLVAALPERVPVGHRLELAARLNRGDRQNRQVVVSWQIGDGQVQRQLMQRAEDATYTAGIDIRVPGELKDEQMRLWIASGDDVLGPAVVGVVPRLQVTGVQLDAKPPAYTGMQASVFNLRMQPAGVPAGSDLRLQLSFNRPVKTAHIEAVGNGGDSVPEVSWQRQDEFTYVGEWLAAKSMRFRVRAQDESGYGNPAAEEYELIVRPDQQPIIQLESPRRSEERTAEATVPLVAMVEDDYGVKAVALEARMLQANDATTQPASGSVLWLLENGGPAATDVQVSAGDRDTQRKRSRLTYPWKLVTFPSSLLKQGDVIEFQLVAQDTFEMNGQTHPAVRTPALRITIISQEQLLQRVYDELRQVATQVSDVRVRQDRLANDTQQLAEDMKGKDAPDDTDRAVAARIAEQQNRAASQARELSLRLAAVAARLEENASPNKPLGEAVKATERLLESAAEESMRPAAADVKQGADANQSREKREAAMNSAQGSQKKGSEQLSAALETLGDVGGIRRAMDMVQELLERQRETTDKTSDFGRQHPGQRPDDLSAQERKELNELAEMQRALSKQTEQTIEQLREMARRQGAEDRNAAEAMTQAAQTAQESSVAEHQQRAGQAISENQSSQAGGSQESAEAGLQQMLDSLRDAQQRKLEELVRRLASMQQQLENLVARQAGHNLDNMSLRKVADAALEAELLKKSRRRDATGASSTGEQLTSSQQQTHQNSSDLVEQLGKIREAGDAATHLSRAAGRMERAVVLLKQQKLVEAFAPPQVEALAALEEALAQVAKSREAAQEEQEEDKQAELRKAYEQLRDQQVQVLKATETLAESMAQARRRSDAVRLKQLAADQGKLAQDSKPLAEKLEELGSAIFTRAARQIGDQMTELSGQLASENTGRPVQLTQRRVVAQINAIIRALTPPKPPESRYADRPPESPGGGGQSGQQRKLPPAAELQLIRDLQAMVNDQTKEITPEEAELAPPVGAEQADVRSSFDQLIKSVLPDVEMPDEKASREELPEEAAGADPAADALDAELLTGDPTEAGEEGPDIRMVARRMTRSGVRLSENRDPGQVTQVVQERILATLDDLIEQARQQQQQQSSSSSSSSQSQQEADPNQQGNDQQSSQSQAQQSAQKSSVRPGETPPEPSGDIRESAQEWGGISQRDRQAIIESTGEHILEKYREITEEYYRALSNKATENR